MDDPSFRQILEYFNLSWQGYRKVRKGVKKRLSKHMQELGCGRVEDYLDRLARQSELEDECRKLLTVSISRFFRDRSLWQALETDVLPDRVAGRRAVFRTWSCGCARGEEVYSFKIVWERVKSAHGGVPETCVWGTDLHPQYLEMAREGVYGRSSLKELHDEQIARYFDKVPGKQRYVIKPSLKRAVRFERLDITRDLPPPVSFEIIFVRNNVLTYYRSPEKERSLEKILRCLAPGGLLITGSHEKLPENFTALQPCGDHPWLFVKKNR